MFLTFNNAGDKIKQLSDTFQGRIGLHSITYTVKWYNIETGDSFEIEDHGSKSVVNIPAGLHNFKSLSKVLTSAVSGLTLEVSKINGLITMVIPAFYKIKLSDTLKKLLGLDDEGWLHFGTYTGDKPVNFSPIKALNVYIEQLDKSKNLVDGKRSSLLQVIPLDNDLKFGDTKTLNFPAPTFKQLAGPIQELEIIVKGNDGTKITNSIDITLQIL